jgi:hypothetical protein
VAHQHAHIGLVASHLGANAHRVCHGVSPNLWS